MYDPNRFLYYELTEDGKGFRIPGYDYVFVFESDGGWYFLLNIIKILFMITLLLFLKLN
jgi:hypothetical protein